MTRKHTLTYLDNSTIIVFEDITVVVGRNLCGWRLEVAVAPLCSLGPPFFVRLAFRGPADHCNTTIKVWGSGLVTINGKSQ